MSEYNYMLAIDFDGGIVLRKKKNDNQYEPVEAYNKRKKTWHPDDDFIGYFIGFEPGKVITEEEAMALVNE